MAEYYIIQQDVDGTLNSYPTEASDDADLQEVWEDNMENAGQTTVLTRQQAGDLAKAINNWEGKQSG